VYTRIFLYEHCLQRFLPFLSIFYLELFLFLTELSIFEYDAFNHFGLICACLNHTLITQIFTDDGCMLCRCSIVGIATGYGLGDWRFGVRVSIVLNVLFSTSSKPALGSTQPPTQWVPRMKRPGLEGNHSSPSSAVVKKSWTTYPPTHTPSWHSAQLLKHRDDEEVLSSEVWYRVVW
jgi:hypothetical protein